MVNLKIGEYRYIGADMSNLRPDKTGLPMVIWVIARTGKEKHQLPRIKVQRSHGDKINTDNWVSVTIEEIPRTVGKKLSTEDYNLVKDFIDANKKALIDHWDGKIDTVDFAHAIQKVGKKKSKNTLTEKDHKPGTFWKEGNEFAARNSEGELRRFKTEEGAKNHSAR